MDCYIVRIYRRDAADPRKVVGLVELVGDEGQSPFQGMDELFSILADEDMEKKKAAKRPGGSG